MIWVAAALQTVATAIGLLRLLVSAVWLHRWLQRGLAPPWALRRGAAVPEAVVELVLRGGNPREVWVAKGAPLADLPAEASRHLPEVHRLLRWVWRVGGLASVVSLALGRQHPGAVARRAGLISLLVGGLGLLSALVLFPPLWLLYHRLAYANEDWRLPDDVLLAALYPERFYQRAAAIWFAAVALVGAGSLATKAWLGRWFAGGAR